MSRYDYYESIERRIEKLERELARKDELFGLFKKKDKGSAGGKVGTSKKLTYDQLDDFISDLKKYEPKVYNNASIGIKELNGSSGKSNVLTIVCDKPATSFNMKFIIYDRSSDGKTAVVKAELGGNQASSLSFDITKDSAIKGACRWIENTLRSAIDDYNEKARKRGGKIIMFN